MFTSWIRLAIIGVIVAAIAAAAIKFTSYLSEKDRLVQERDQLIAELRAKAEGLQRDNDSLKVSNASLEADRDKKRDELARVQLEMGKLHTVDEASSKRLNELERKLSDRERLEQIERLRTSRRAELLLNVVNKSAKCDLENFFNVGGACKNGVWVKDGERLVPMQAPAAQPPAEARPVGDTNATK